MSYILIFQLSLLVVLVLFSGLFSSSETALFSLEKTTLRQWQTDGNKYQKMVSFLMNDYHGTLVAILIANNFVNILAAITFNNLTSVFISGFTAPLIAGTIITVILLIFGEITPKSIAYSNSNKIAPIIAPLVLFCYRLFKPLISFLKKISTRILVWFSGESTDSTAITPDEYQTYITLGKNIGAFSDKESHLLERILQLRSKTVLTAMIPRIDVKIVDVSWDYQKVTEAIQRHCHRLIPAVNGDLDNLVGILDVRMFLLASTGVKRSWQKTCLLKPIYVPEHASLNAVLEILRGKKQSMSVVVHEYGGSSGIFKVEDIVEEVVGEMTDEYDTPTWTITKINHNHWRLSGLIQKHQITELIDIELPEGSSETVGGLLTEQIGKIPDSGDSWECNGYLFQVRKVNQNRIIELDLVQKGSAE